MRFSSLGLIGLGTALALTSFVSSASAVVTFDQNLASGWHQGTGTSNGHFTVDTEANGVELGLRASHSICRADYADRKSLHRSGGQHPARQGFVEFRVFGKSRFAAGHLFGADDYRSRRDIGVRSEAVIPDNKPNGGPLYQNSENLGFAFSGRSAQFQSQCLRHLHLRSQALQREQPSYWATCRSRSTPCPSRRPGR